MVKIVRSVVIGYSERSGRDFTELLLCIIINFEYNTLE